LLAALGICGFLRQFVNKERQAIACSLIMSDVIVRVRPNGPLLVEGPIKVVDPDGNEFPINKSKPAIALCRCGHSQTRPFCDGAHKAAGFCAADTAPVPPAESNAE